MIKFFFISIFLIQVSFAQSIYENNSGQIASGIYENEYEEIPNSGYLDSVENESNVQIDSLSYGKSDSTGKQLSFNLKNLNKISYSDKSALLQKFSSFTRYHTGLTFYGFQHDYSTEFKKMFYDAKKADSMLGSLVFSLDQKILGHQLSLNYLTGAGVSFFKGSGYFADDGSEADMRITLWILPIDFGLSGVYSFNNYLRMLVGAGISGVAAIQSRSDLGPENEEKTIFQFGYGPFVTAKLNIGLSSFFKNFSLAMFRDYGVTNTFLNIEYRFQQYSKFQENFEIKGSALGAGISFNFM